MPFESHQIVLFRRYDPAGIVFHPRFLEMISDCVKAFFDKIGPPFEILRCTAGVPIARISTRFHAPSRHGDRLMIALEVAHIGTSKLGLSLQATSDEQQRFNMVSALVYVDRSGRAQKWPSDTRAAMIPYLRSAQ